jgi:monofunctional biosynthetic peptidoglycan transglycosylase
VRRGQWLSQQNVVDRLNDLGYAQRPAASAPGEFAIGDQRISLQARGGDQAGRVVHVAFNPKAGAPPAATGSGPLLPSGAIDRIEIEGTGPVPAVRLDPPLLTSLITASREKRRRVSLGLIPRHMAQAVLAIEDRRFYEHPGIDPIRIVGAIITNIRGTKPYLVGASTITQQLVKNLFFTTRFGFLRKAAEAAVTPAAELILGKRRILELYLNVVEWGPGVYGAEAAANHHYRTSARRLSREQSARLAAILPSPLRRKPARMDRYSAIIQTRMTQMGW